MFQGALGESSGSEAHALGQDFVPPSLSTLRFNLEQGYLRFPEATGRAQTSELRRRGPRSSGG